MLALASLPGGTGVSPGPLALKVGCVLALPVGSVCARARHRAPGSLTRTGGAEPDGAGPLAVGRRLCDGAAPYGPAGGNGARRGHGRARETHVSGGLGAGRLACGEAVSGEALPLWLGERGVSPGKAGLDRVTVDTQGC